MIDDTIDVLTELIIKEHFKNEKNKYVISKEELIRFCIKMMKEIQRVYEGL